MNSVNMHEHDMPEDDNRTDGRERLPSLTDDYLNGTLGLAETVELESLLATDPIARQAFLDHSLLHAQLAATPVALGYELTPEGHEYSLSPVAAGFQRADSGLEPDTIQSCGRGRKNTAVLAAGLLGRLLLGRLLLGRLLLGRLLPGICPDRADSAAACSP